VNADETPAKATSEASLGTGDTGPAKVRRFALLAAVALAVVHFGWLMIHSAPAIMSPDANGYMAQARLIANEGRTSFSPASPLQFVGMHWLETKPGVFHSRYPAGLPMLQAAAWKIGGIRAAVLINRLLASATVLLVFALARRWVAAPYALLAAAVIATVPVTNQHALDADAHIAATFFLVAGVLALLRFHETRRVAIGLLAGVLLGAVPTIRYPEAIVGVAMAVWLLVQFRPLSERWPAVVGAAIPIGALCLHNAAAYGAFWRTGYALTNEQTGFGFGYFVQHALPYVQGLSGQGLALFFAFGVAGLAALVADARRRQEGILFAGFVVHLVLLYLAYYFGAGGIGGAGGSLRFLIPTFPFFAVAAVWLLARIGERLGLAGRVAVIVVAALQLSVGLGASAQTVANAKTSLASAARARIFADTEIPAGSIVILERQLAESLDAVGKWKIVEESLVSAAGMGFGPGGFGGRGGPRGAFGPPMDSRPGEEGNADDDAPSPQQRGKNRALQERYAGLRPDERRARIWADLAEWADGRPVFWFARSLETVEDTLPTGADFVGLGEVDAPSMTGPGAGGGMMPGGPGGGVPGRLVRAGGAAPGATGKAFRGPGGRAGQGFRAKGGAGNPRAGGVNAPATKLHVVKIDFAKK
jgi:hypothetical protein